MSQFKKAIDLWANNNEEKIKSGELVLQRGQYVKCGDDNLSRYVGHTQHTINVVHGKDYHEVNKRFLERVEFAKMAEKRNLK